MTDKQFMQLAIRLAQRGYGTVSPNPLVGAVLVKAGKIIGRGWHRKAGLPHGEIEAFRDAERRGHDPRGATLYVTLEPCSTHGRTPPCTEAIVAAGIKRVVVGTTDPNPRHAGKAFKLLKEAHVAVDHLKAKHQTVENECARLNEAFNQWIVHRTPFVTLKAAMTLDGKIATAKGESKWITGEEARDHGMYLRRGSDAILVGINTLLADDPSLTVRPVGNIQHSTFNTQHSSLRRIVLDSMARTPLDSKVVTDEYAGLTTIVVSRSAPRARVTTLGKLVKVLTAPATNRTSRIPLPWLLKTLGAQNVTSLLVEGGGEVHASFLERGLAHRVAFFYAAKILGGRDSCKAVGGEGIRRLADVIQLRDVEWKQLRPDLFMTGRVASKL